ncbi:MAG: MSHA pilin protein MshD [Lentisphaeria bacterium]
MTIKHRVGQGVTLVETTVFLVVVSVALVALLSVYSQAVLTSVDPVVRTRALELGQAQLDEILSRKFDENTPTGGVPACDSLEGVACLGIAADPDFDDVGDYDNFTQNYGGDYDLIVGVSEAGVELGIPSAQARRISVVVSMPRGRRATPDSVALTAYKTNF